MTAMRSGEKYNYDYLRNGNEFIRYELKFVIGHEMDIGF